MTCILGNGMATIPTTNKWGRRRGQDHGRAVKKATRAIRLGQGGGHHPRKVKVGSRGAEEAPSGRFRSHWDDRAGARERSPPSQGKSATLRGGLGPSRTPWKQLGVSGIVGAPAGWATTCVGKKGGQGGNRGMARSPPPLPGRHGGIQEVFDSRFPERAGDGRAEEALPTPGGCSFSRTPRHGGLRMSNTR